MVLDVLAGFVALCLVFAFVISYSFRDLRIFSAATAVIFFLAGLSRRGNRGENPWLIGFLIALGGIVLLVLMQWTWPTPFEEGYVPSIIVFSLLMATSGATTRRLLFMDRAGAACVLGFVSVFAVTLASLVAVPAYVTHLSSKHVNRPAPSFSFVTPDGETVTSDDLRGRVVVLAFWATWCGPTRREFPVLQAAYDQYKLNPKVVFYAVGGPWYGDTIESEAVFARQTNIKLPLVFDSHGAMDALGVNAFPALIVLDSQGRVRLIHGGYDGSEHLSRHISEEIDALLGS
jgi:thiol-disulfide isomerase/thioredoxin